MYLSELPKVINYMLFEYKVHITSMIEMRFAFVKK